MIDRNHQRDAVAGALIECRMRILGFEENGLPGLQREALFAGIEGELALDDEEELRPIVMMMKLTAAARRSRRDLHREIAVGQRHDVADFEPAKMGWRREGFRILISPDL